MQNLNHSNNNHNTSNHTSGNHRILYIDPISGISGDMFLAACVDLGVSQEMLIAALQSLPIDPFTIAFNTVSKKGIRALATSITFTSSIHSKQDHHAKHEHHSQDNQHSHHSQHSHRNHHAHRHMRDIEQIITNSSLTDNAKSLATSIFHIIAKAEAFIHNTTIEKVHFHEVGAMDSIIDIVGAAICLDSFQVDEVICGHVPTGFGTVQCDHGEFPIPAPATLEILTGVPIRNLPIESELTTPTGAAIIKCTTTSYSSQLPNMVVDKIGYGAGSRDLDRPNVLRLVLGHTLTEEASPLDVLPYSNNQLQQSLWMLEATIDDLQPELYQHVIDRLLTNGAKDVMVIPGIMKKDRAGCLLRALTEDNHITVLKELIFKETTSLGVRSWPVLRDALKREFHEVMIRDYKVTIKIGLLDNQIVNIAPEYGDCKKVAIATSVPIKTIYQEALANYYRHNNNPAE